MIDRDRPLKREISKNIRRLMEERGYTQIKLSLVSGISKSTLSDYVNCKTLINPGNVEKLSDALGVSKAEIDPSFKSNNLSVKEDKTLYSISNTVKLPIVGRVSCGNGTVAYEGIEGYEETPSSWVSGGEYFYLRARGDSMVNARINDGDLVLIRKQHEVEDGEIAVVLLNDEVFLKRVYYRKETMVLQSENTAYPPLFADPRDGYVKIIGKLKKVVIIF